MPHVSRFRRGIVIILALSFVAATAARAQVLDGFTWVDLKSDTERVVTVTKVLAAEKYTALREIGVVGQQALVITATRGDLLAQPQQDRFNVYAVSLKDGSAEALLDGAHLRIVEWQKFYDYDSPELLATYDDCSGCQATTFLTAFYLDRRTKKWRVRWPRDVEGAPLNSPGAGAEEAYALFMNVDERVVLDTWARYPQKKKASRGGEYLFEYSIDPASDQGAAQPLSGRDAAAVKLRLCKGEGVVFGIASGQDGPACKAGVRSAGGKPRSGAAKRPAVMSARTSLPSSVKK